MKTEEECPLAEVDKRLSDVHTLWHRTNDSYFEPEEFRINLNALIQTARTVTFILQSNKSKIPDFDNWYSAQQDIMKANHIMKWLVAARNEVEKQGDLSTQSLINVSIVASHLDEFPSVELEVDLFDGIDDLFQKIPNAVLKKQVLKHGMLKVERKWVHDKLPDMELMEALAHCFGCLANVVSAAHEQMGLITSESREQSRYEHLDGRPPCMENTDEFHTINIQLSSGARMTMHRESIELDSIKAAEVVAEMYGDLPVSTDEGKTEFEKTCYYFFQIARALIEKDGYHQPMTFLVLEDQSVRPMVTPAADRQEKYMLSRAIAGEVKKKGAIAVITVNEVWRSQAPLPPFQYPVDQPDRTEAISLVGISKDGEIISLSAQMNRQKSLYRRMRKKMEKITVEETVRHDSGSLFFLAPVFEVWGIDPTNQKFFTDDDST